MRFTMHVNMDNDAFVREVENEDGEFDLVPDVSELARILRDTAEDVDVFERTGRTGRSVRDINGNTVGQWEVTA